MSRLVRTLIVLFALLGLVAASMSLYVHYRLLTVPGYASVCDVNAKISCTQAYLSPYGSFLGVPVALFGVLWFVFALFLVFADKWVSPAMGESLTSYLFVGSTLALAAILYFAYAAFFVLKVVCVFCLLTYVAVIGMFIIAGISTSVSMTSIPRRLLRDLRTVVTSRVAVVVALLFAAGAGSAVAFFPREGVRGLLPGQPTSAGSPQDQRAEFEQYWETLPRVTVPVPSGGAAVLVVKFTDFQCPMCGASYREYKPILARYQAELPGAVKVVSKMYPLQPECNVNVPGPYHSAACDAAAAWIIARGKGRGDAMEDWLYANGALLSPAYVREGARTVGMIPDLTAEYPRVLEEIKADVALGRLLGINSTPTFFINGVKVVGAIAPQYFDMAIAYELRKAGKTK
jgi:uncharacterized membrane protein/protein-disulfide isomerase